MVDPNKISYQGKNAEHIPLQVYNTEQIPPQISPPNLSFRCIMRNTSPLKYIMRNISPPNIPPNVNIADQIPLQFKIGNTVSVGSRGKISTPGFFGFLQINIRTPLRSDLLEKFPRKSFFSVFFKLILDIRVSLRSDLLRKFQR